MGALTLAFLWQDESYWSSLFIEVGAAIVLLVPLLLVQQQFKRRQEQLSERIDNVAQQVERIQLDQLDEAAQSRVQQAAREDEALFQAFEQSPSFESAFALMMRARALNAISDEGIRVSIRGHYSRPGIQLRLRFRVMRQVGWIEVRVEDRNGDQKDDPILWRMGQAADYLIGNVITVLQSMNSYKPDNFQPQAMLEQFLGTLKLGIESRAGTGPIALDEPIIECPRQDWIITTSALRHLERDIVLRTEDFVADTERGDDAKGWERRPSSVRGSGNGDFREAWETAAELLFRRWTRGTTL